jgi:hypothetical protein
MSMSQAQLLSINRVAVLASRSPEHKQREFKEILGQLERGVFQHW